jgi:hypothetical protein
VIDGDALSEAATSLSIRTHVWRKAAEICDGFPESVYRYVCATAPTTIEEFYASRYIPGILSLYHPDIMTVAMESTQRVLWALRSVIELGGLRGKDRAAVLCVANQLGLEASANETLMLWRGDRTALFEGLPTSWDWFVERQAVRAAADIHPDLVAATIGRFGECIQVLRRMIDNLAEPPAEPDLSIRDEIIAILADGDREGGR